MHLAWLRKRGYADAYCVLPHDGSSGEKVIDATYESAVKAAGFEAKTVPNQGAGAAAMRIEAGRRLFPRMWFDDTNTKAGRTALAWYHEKQDERRDIGLGPAHDWASHGADAFGLMAIDYEEPTSSLMPQVDNGWVR